MPILSYFSQGDSLHGALTLHPTDLTFDTDDVRMTAVAGSSNGRIFLAGGDGGVHELTYRGSTPASSASAGVADALLDGAASAASRVLGVEALRPHPKRAKRVDHGVDGTGGHPLITGLLRSIGGSMLAGPTPPPLLDLTVDHDRGLLYSLAADGCIRVFRIGGPDGPVEDALGPLPSSSSLSGGGLSGAGAPVVDAATSFTPCGVVADVEAACKAFAGNPRASTINRPRPDIFRPGLAAAALKSRAALAAAAATATAAAAAGGRPPVPSSSAADTLAADRIGAAATGVAWPLVSIHVVPPCDSRRIHLVAAAASGARLYFTLLSPERYNATGAGGGAGGLYATQQQQQQSGAAYQQQQGGGGGGSHPALTLVYVRMPPPVSTVEDYTSGDYSAYRPEGFTPAEDAVGALKAAGGTHCALVVGGTVALLARPRQDGSPPSSSSSSTGGGGSSGDLGSDRLLLIARDPCMHGGPSASGAGWSSQRMNESVSEIVLDGKVLAMAELPRSPILAYDGGLVAPGSGVMSLPGGETAALPLLVRAIAEGRGIVPAVQPPPPLPLAAPSSTVQPPPSSVTTALKSTLKRGFAAAFGGGSDSGAAQAPTPLTRTEAVLAAAAAAASSAASSVEEGDGGLSGAMALQEGLLDSSVPITAHHIVRRRLWRDGPGEGEPVTPFSLQHTLPPGAAAVRSIVVLTTYGVYRLAVSRPVDQLARLLTSAGGVKQQQQRGVGGGGYTAPGTILMGGGGGGGYASGPSLTDFLRWFTTEESATMMVALACAGTGLLYSQQAASAVGGSSSYVNTSPRRYRGGGPSSSSLLSEGGTAASPSPSSSSPLALAAAAAYEEHAGLPGWKEGSHEYRVVRGRLVRRHLIGN